MPRDERRRQKAAQKHAAKRKQKRQVARLQQPRSTQGEFERSLVRQAAHWPLLECRISKHWRDTTRLTQIVVARQAPNGEVVAGVFLIDLGCLGVKSAFTRDFASRREYERTLIARIAEQDPLTKADLNLVAKVINEALTYAKQLGLKPDPDYYEAAQLLEGAEPAASDVEVPLGYEGKPYFAPGPYDDSAKIMAKLDRAVGAGNYNFTLPIAGDLGLLAPQLELLDDEGYEDDEDVDDGEEEIPEDQVLEVDFRRLDR